MGHVSHDFPETVAALAFEGYNDHATPPTTSQMGSDLSRSGGIGSGHLGTVARRVINSSGLPAVLGVFTAVCGLVTVLAGRTLIDSIKRHRAGGIRSELWRREQMVVPVGRPQECRISPVL